MRVLILLTATFTAAACAFGWTLLPHAQEAADTAHGERVAAIADLIGTGQLQQARERLPSIAVAADRDALRDAIDQRARWAAHLAERAGEDLGRSDLAQAARRLAWASSLDRSVSQSQAAQRHDVLRVRTDSALARARDCAAQRNFDCVTEAARQVRQSDRHAPTAMFWDFYVADWRPSHTTQETP